MSLFKRTVLVLSILVSLFGQYKWILPESKQLTSSFCEYRVGHYHAGIDFRTPAGIGMKLVAPCDGFVKRVTVSPWGYGRALYFEGQNDFVTVYAHLSRFSDIVQKRVRTQQYKESKYPVNLWFQKNEIPVKAGQVIAYTGASGIGSPHLHFETRRGLSKYINPFLMGFNVKDNIRPKFQGLMIVPISDDAYVEGYSTALSYLELMPKGTINYTIKDTIRFCGEIGLSVRAFDWQLRGNPNRMGIYELMLISGEKTLYYAKYDSFLFEDTKQIAHAFDLFSEEWGKNKYHKLFKPDFLDAFPYNFVGNGIIKAKEGDVLPLRIIARDFYGNSSELSLVLKSVKKPSKAGFRLSLYDWGGAIIMPNWLDENEIELVKSIDNGKEWKYFEERREDGYISFRGKAGDIVRMAYSQSSGLKRRYYFVLPEKSPFNKKDSPIHTSYKVDENFVYLSFKSQMNMGYPEEIFINPKTPYDVDTPSQSEVLIRIPLSSIQNSTCQVSLKLYDGRRLDETFQSQEITQKGGEIRFDGLRLKFNKNSLFHDKVRFVCNRDSLSFGLYPKSLVMPKMFRIWLKSNNLSGEYIGRLWADKFYFVGNDSTKAPQKPYLSGLVRTGGQFAITQDTLAPEIEILSLNGRKISFSIIDEGSGFGADELPDTYIDGKWILNIYDPENDRSKIEFSKVLTKGKHELLIVARDKVGNEIEIRRSFDVK